jgi:formylglycine-generating enzyme
MYKTFLTAFSLNLVVLTAFAQSEGSGPNVSINAKPSAKQIKELVAKTKGNLAYLPSGTFMMGDWGDPESGLPYDANADSKPVHKVTLEGFSMMKFKVTYAEFDLFTVVKGLPKINQEEYRKPKRGDTMPAGVSWYGAKAYCKWLAELTMLPFDLPTEAQWEYAARSGGKKYLMATDNGMFEPGRNYPSYEQRKDFGGRDTARILPVGKFPPNPAGIYGMNELTYEWVNDWYDPDYYKRSPVKNPKGPEKGTKKVQRGDFGGAPEGALVFGRSSSTPIQLTIRIQDDLTEESVPYEGYSSVGTDTFRCAVNTPTRIR